MSEPGSIPGRVTTLSLVVLVTNVNLYVPYLNTVPWWIRLAKFGLAKIRISHQREEGNFDFFGSAASVNNRQDWQFYVHSDYMGRLGGHDVLFCAL